MLFRFISAITLLLSLSTFAQNEHGLVNWLTFKEAQEKNKTVQKPFLVDFYTDWCGWCKHMMKTTYSNEGLASYINANFYPVKFDAETKDTIEYNGKIYKPSSPEPRTAHELTIKFLGNKLSYPSTVFITNNYEYNLLVQGYLEDQKIQPMLIFMVENAWRTSSFDDYNRHFTHTFLDTVFPKVPVKTYDITELEGLQKKAPKKVLINITTGYCNSCMIMKKTAFVDTSLGNYINKNYYLVNLDASRTDTIVFRGQKFYHAPVNNYPVHQLALALSSNRLTFPTLSIMDEQFNLLDVLNYYQGPERLKYVVRYFGQNDFKTKTFQQFVDDYSKPPAPKTGKK